MRLVRLLSLLVLCFLGSSLLPADTAVAQGLSIPGLSVGQKAVEKPQDKPLDKQQLQHSLDAIIGTLEDQQKRADLLKQLKALRDTTRELPGKKASDVVEGQGMLDVLAVYFSDFSGPARSLQRSAWLWSGQGLAALTDYRHLVASSSWKQLSIGGGEAAVGLATWLLLLLALMWAARRLLLWRDIPQLLPRDPSPKVLGAHFLQQVLPWALAFAIMIAGLHQLPISPFCRAAVLVVAYVTLCARLLTAVLESVACVFVRGHRQVAVDIIRRKALKPLFVIGVLVSLGDAVLSERLTLLLGGGLTQLVAMISGVCAGLLSIWLVFYIRRPVTHLLGNRRYSRRKKQVALHGLVKLVARLWFVPALLFVGGPLVAILWTGGKVNEVLPKAVLCIVLLIVTLVLTGVLRRHSEKKVRRERSTDYGRRLIHFGYTLLHSLLWLMFVEAILRIWDLSLLAIGGKGALAGIVGQALLGVVGTVLVAWLVWILADTAIERALSGKRRSGQQRANMRAQTIRPLVRNIIFFTILTIAFIFGLSNLGVNVTPLLAGAGVIGLAIGFGAQTLVQDLITGLFILVEDSLAVGDFVQILGFMGTVEGLSLRTVRLRDLDGVLHIITFSHIDSIHNMSRQFGIALLKIRIPHELPIDDAIAMMKETAAELRQDPIMRHKVWSPLEIQGVHSFEEGCAVLRMRMRTSPEYQWEVGRDFNLRLKRRMESAFVGPGAPRVSVHLEGEGGSYFGAARRRPDNTAGPTALTP